MLTEFTGFRFEIVWESGVVGTEGRLGASGQNGGRNGGGAFPFRGKQAPMNRVLGSCRGGDDATLPIELDGVRIGVAILRASDGEAMKGRSLDTLARPGRSTTAIASVQFRRATILLRLLIHDALSATLAELRSEELASARCDAGGVEMKSPRRRDRARRDVLRHPGLAVARDGGSGVPAVVGLILDFVHAAYAQPISLKDFARDQGLNPSYLSTVFSSNVGVPFKKYLTDFRVGKARELMRNPTTKISAVAAAVGYADANRFLAVFKAATGFSPGSFLKTEARR